MLILIIILIVLIGLILGHLFLWQARNTEFFFTNTPIFFAHRGALHSAPENSLEAYRAAIDLGFTALELDVVSTRDGVVVCSHNFDLERESDSIGFIDELNYSALKDVKFGKDKYPAQIKGLTSLEDILESIPEDILLNIEIKTRSAFNISTLFRLNKLLKNYTQKRKIMISSFNPLIILICKYLNRNFVTGMIYETLNYFYLINIIHPDCINLEAGLINHKHVNWARKRRLRIGSWTVNTRPAIQQIINLGVDAVYTDRPEYAPFRDS
jgi:glycerophosphoryl diester phosphodiesterase